MNDQQSPSRLDRLLNFLGSDPHNPNLLSDALQLAQVERNAEKGQALLAHIEKYGSPSPEVAAHSALLHLQLGDTRKAAQYGDEALAGGIHDGVVRFNAAFAHLCNGNFARVDELLAGLDADSESTELLIVHARALHHLERSDEAKALLSTALRQRADCAEALGMLALLEQEDDALESAMQLAEKALQLEPTQLEALLAMAGSHLDTDNMQEAQACFQAAVTHHPDCGRAWSGLAQVAFSGFDFTNAELYLREAVKHMPDHIGTWHLLAWIYILQNDPAKARDALESSMEIDRSFGDTHGGLAVVDVMQGRDDDARIKIRKALRLAPEGMAARYAELLLLQKSGDADGARLLVETTLDQPVSDGGELRRTLVEKKLREFVANQATTGKMPH